MERKKQIVTVVLVLLVMILVAGVTSAYIIIDERQRSIADANQKPLIQLNPQSLASDLITKNAEQEETVKDGDALVPLTLSEESITGEGEFQGFIPVLMYHSFSETHQGTSVVIHPTEFKEQLSYLKEQGYTALSVYDVVEAIYGTKSLPEKPFLITMDDGYLDNYEYAFPILQELEMKANIFVVTSQMGETPTDRAHFSWEQAQEMIDSGLVTIQSHTHDLHYKMDTPHGPRSALVGKRTLKDGREESEEEHWDRVYNDLMTSKKLIQQYTTDHVVSFAYPYGVYSDQILEIVQEVGFLLLFTIEKGLFSLEDSVYSIPRLNVPTGWTGADILREIEKLRETLEP